MTSTYGHYISLPSVHAPGDRLCGLNVTSVFVPLLGGDGAGWIHGHGLHFVLCAPSSCIIIAIRMRGSVGTYRQGL